MPRQNVSTAMREWLTGTLLPCALFFEGTFASGPVYLWTGFGPITWNGQTWFGIGTLGGVSAIDEGSTVEAKGIAVTLSAFDSTLLPLVMQELQFGAPMTVYLAGFNAGVLIDNPIAAFVGQMDQPVIDVDGSTARMSIACESPFVEMNVAVDRRYTQEDQNRDWPGDLGMSFVDSIQEMTIYVGSAPTTAGNI